MFVDSLVDSFLELSIVGSFSRIGPAVRRQLGAWQQPAPAALAGKTALVTGPTSGLGRMTALRLADLGARVVLLGRDRARLEQLRDELVARTGVQRYSVVVVDMSSLASVRAAVASVTASETRLDILVDNAGAIYPERGETDEGIERALAVLVVGPFALMNGLTPLLRAAPAGRIISVTSGGMYFQPVDLDDLQWQDRPYVGARVYAQAKRIQVALVRERARRLRGTGVAVNAMHPGWADTPGLAESLPRFYGFMGPLLRSTEEGVDTVIWLATTPDLAAPGGRLYLDRRPRPFDRLPQTRLRAAERRRLWHAISELAARA